MDERRLSGRAGDGRRLFDDAAAARRFQRRLREVAPDDGGYSRRALQYDESGYPIDPHPSLAARVRRLITG
jgi:hypothetical protein